MPRFFPNRPIRWKTRFVWQTKKTGKKINRKPALVGHVPQWVANIHFDLMGLRICIPTRFDDVEPGKLYLVEFSSIPAGLSGKCSVRIIKLIEKETGNAESRE